MSYDWTAQEDERASIQPGYHKVICTKVMTHNKEGEAYRSKDGDPQLYSVWQDETDAESLAIFTLSAKAAWTLRKCLQRVGANVERMARDNITPGDFADQSFAEKVLVGKSGWALAKEKKGYINLDFVTEDDVPPAVLKAANVAAGQAASSSQEIDDSDIPF